MKPFLYLITLYLVTILYGGFTLAVKEEDLINELDYYGYIEDEYERVSDLRPEQKSKGIKLYQHTFKLKETGILDKETIEQLGKVRCGNVDYDVAKYKYQKPEGILRGRNRGNRRGNRRSKRFAATRFKWDDFSTLTWKITSPCQGSPEMTLEDMEQSFEQATRLWSEHTSRIRFVKVEDHVVADIDVFCGETNHPEAGPFPFAPNVLAHAIYPVGEEYTQYQALKGDCHFYNGIKWSATYKDGSTYDLLQVAAHELGHSLGLNHSFVNGALMYPIYNPSSYLHGYISTDDINGIQSIYNGIVAYEDFCYFDKGIDAALTDAGGSTYVFKENSIMKVEKGNGFVGEKYKLSDINGVDVSSIDAAIYLPAALQCRVRGRKCVRYSRRKIEPAAYFLIKGNDVYVQQTTEDFSAAMQGSFEKVTLKDYPWMKGVPCIQSMFRDGQPNNVYMVCNGVAHMNVRNPAGRLPTTSITIPENLDAATTSNSRTYLFYGDKVYDVSSQTFSGVDTGNDVDVRQDWFKQCV